MPSAEVQKMIPQIQEYLATQPVERAYLFGSCSRGEETPESDVDILVTYTDSDSLSLMDISRMMVAPLSHREEENEFLLKRGSEFVVRNAYKDGNQTVVELEVQE